MTLQEHEHGRQIDTEVDEPSCSYPQRLEPNFRPDFGIEHYRRQYWWDEPWALFRWWMTGAVLGVVFGLIRYFFF